MFTKPVLPQTSFYQLFAQTVLWTAINVFFHVTLGVLLALMLNRKLRGRTFYRALLILPWAIPAVASLQIWRTEFNYQYGAVNQILALFGIAPIPWMSDPDLELRGHDHHQRLAGRAVHDGHHPGRRCRASRRTTTRRPSSTAPAARQQFGSITVPLLKPDPRARPSCWACS